LSDPKSDTTKICNYFWFQKALSITINPF